jgi:hypothetical protein
VDVVRHHDRFEDSNTGKPLGKALDASSHLDPSRTQFDAIPHDGREQYALPLDADRDGVEPRRGVVPTRIAAANAISSAWSLRRHEGIVFTSDSQIQ